jgi:hypothetical protein
MKRFITASDSHEVILLATVQDGMIRWETFLEVPLELQSTISPEVLQDVGELMVPKPAAVLLT